MSAAGRRVLVTGGAGYIGSHAAQALLDRGHRVVALDDLSEGHEAALPKGAELRRVDLRDEAAVRACFEKERPDAVMHFAASCLVGESVADPGKYYRNNLEASLILLRAMRAQGCSAIVLSSTAAVYGEPKRVPIDESHPCEPINPYGATKRMFEQVLADHARAHGLRWIALRYFNAAGASLSGARGEDHEPESHLIPLVLRAALGGGAPLTIHGDDYATPDGTCVRDYIHVEDLAEAHLLALDALEKGAASGAFNLGTGEGFTVRQVLEHARRITKSEIAATVGPRRAGDPATLVADGRKAREVLGWKPTRSDLETIVSSAWRWHRSHPRGYEG